MRSTLLWLRKWLHAIGGVIVLTSSLISPTEAFGQTKSYVVTDLSSEGANEVPTKLNNLGDIAGRLFSASEHGTRAAIWNHSGFEPKHVRKDVGALSGGDYSSAADINDAGQVVGASNTSKGMLPFIWTTTSGLQRVPLLRGDSCGQANGINKDGHIVGYSSGPNGAKAFLWTHRAGVRKLEILSGGNYSRAQDLNDFDEVVGTSDSAAGERAVLWTKTGSVRDLGTLPGDSASKAAAINNGGDVVGYSKGPRGLRAFLWTKDNGMEELGVLPGGDSSRALAISNLGEVVGSSTSASGDRAFIWTKETGMMDLNNASSADLGIVLFEAHSINDKGQIIAMGKNSSEGSMGNMLASPQHEDCAPAPPASFLLTPIAAK
jgi:probable HAF family extracellular repeat protein